MKRFAIYLYGPEDGPLPSRFEEVAERLEALERMHFEWDGSFVWRGEEADPAIGDTAKGDAAQESSAWQLDGMLYDRGERIQYVDLKGCCPRDAWRSLLAILSGEGSEELSILRLPDRKGWDLSGFEEEIWGKPSLPN